MEKLFFQSSLPRAGITLLQNILAQNPSIYATPTSGVLELIIRTKLEPMPSKAKTLLGRDVTDWIYNNYKWFYEQFNYKK